MSDHDLDPPSADGAHAHVAGALVDALDAPVPPGMLAAVQRRATRRHRRRAAAVGAGVSAVLAAAVLAGPAVGPAQDRERRVAAPSPSPVQPTPLTPPPSAAPTSPLLVQRQVESVAPGAGLVDRVSDRAVPATPGLDAVGGWCGSSVLMGAVTPTSLWSGRWEQLVTGAPVTSRSVDEEVLRWEGPAAAGAARDYVEATSLSATRCDPDLELPGPVYRSLPVVVPGAPGAVQAVAAAEGPETSWYVRTLVPVGDEGLVVDLDLVVVADTARGASDVAVPLAAQAVERAAAWSTGLDERPGPGAGTSSDGEVAPGGDGAPGQGGTAAGPPVLSLEEVRRWRPDARAKQGPESERADLLPVVIVGFCGGQRVQVADPVAGWFSSFEGAPGGEALYVSESLTRWDDPSAVGDYLEAARAGETDCQPDDPSAPVYSVTAPPAGLDPRSAVAVAGPTSDTPLHRVSAYVPSADGLSAAQLLVWVPADSPREALESVTPLLVAAADAAGRTP